MRFVQPATWAEALEATAALPGGLPVAGGTDVMVDLNFHRSRVLDWVWADYLKAGPG